MGIFVCFSHFLSFSFFFLLIVVHMNEISNVPQRLMLGLKDIHLHIRIDARGKCDHVSGLQTHVSEINMRSIG